ncbi:putative bifunctional diguanylate cyclase/phosphodiesterase [Billgrantia saliphila]|uniref:putative bifunctional diguanylate cyclase/phosphodiesterase n=1 Tax=Billgrantia saliphila TaxID=1848458 RepID=UPI000CE4ACFB|nr:EAL domain-containing protein [Halomonas saliphila]
MRQFATRRRSPSRASSQTRHDHSRDSRHSLSPPAFGDDEPRCDDITGLTTRRQAERQLATLLAQAAARETRVGILHLDIDRLKEINHSLGYVTGDAYLQRVGQRIANFIGETGSVSRLGSDEFMVVLPDVADVDELLPQIEGLLTSIRQPVELEGQEVLGSCCIGASLYPDDGHTVTMLMRHANLARRRAQVGGSGQFCFFSPELLDDGPDCIALRCDLRGALERRELELRYRPILCAQSGQVVAVSAQPRWHSPRFGVLEPGEWMRAARDIGQVDAICQWVLTHACRHAYSWHEAGSGVRVVVNVADEGLRGNVLPERVRDALLDSSLPAELLEIELTESSLMQDPEHAIDILEQLKVIGVRLAIDGFGSGYSMLSHISRLPVDTLKLGPLFIDGCLDNARHQAIVRSVIGMAHELGIRVAASGVGSRSQVDYLREQGCDLLQGRLWSRMEYSDPKPMQRK